MGRYAAEMGGDDGFIKKLRNRYCKARKKLEKIPVAKLTVGELNEVLDLLSEKRTPHSFRDMFFTERVVKEMRRLLRKIKSKK